MAQESSIDIVLDRFDRVYRPGETIKGTVDVYAYKGWTHNGIVLTSEGVLTLSGESVKDSIIFQHTEELLPAGRAPEGLSKVPFEIRIPPKSNNILESYYGFYITVIYSIGISCDRGMMKKALSKKIEFVMELPSTKITEPNPMNFDIRPQGLAIPEKVRKKIPDFRISGKLHRTNCNVNHPFTGEITINHSIGAISVLELQLARIESVYIPTSNQYTVEASEVINLQIGKGNICRDLVLPIYMVFPRLWSCPTVISSEFKIEFEINLHITFEDGIKITEKFPIHLSRV